KNVVGTFGRNNWREWPKCLPVLDPLVQLVFHLRLTRVRQDTAIAESAWPKFRTALKPGKHVAVSQQFCRIPAYVRTEHASRLEANDPPVCGKAHILIRIFNAKISMLHDK